MKMQKHVLVCPGSPPESCTTKWWPPMWEFC